MKIIHFARCFVLVDKKKLFKDTWLFYITMWIFDNTKTLSQSILMWFLWFAKQTH